MQKNIYCLILCNTVYVVKVALHFIFILQAWIDYKGTHDGDFVFARTTSDFHDSLHQLCRRDSQQFVASIRQQSVERDLERQTHDPLPEGRPWNH